MKFYVTKTWHDFPDGGSYGAVVEADSFTEAERRLMLEMAKERTSEFAVDEEEGSVAYWMEAYSGEWHTVDCFVIQSFISAQCPQIKNALEIIDIMQRMQRIPITLAASAYSEALDAIEIQLKGCINS